MSRRHLSLLAGPLAFVAIWMWPPEALTEAGAAVLAVTCWVAIWWITEPIPLAATSLLPVVLFPLTGAVDLYTTTTTYFSPMIMLFMGGFVLALAIERWGLHQRIALYIICRVGTNGPRMVLGFMLATAFLSMWISNTATTMMMLPIGVAIAKKLSQLYPEGSAQRESLQKSLMLGIAYSASIGGLATLIGTPTNVIFSGMVEQLYDVRIAFAEWMLLGFPVSLLIVLLGWWYLTHVAFPFGKLAISGADKAIHEQLVTLGPITAAERRVAWVFAGTALTWIGGSLVLQQWLPGLDDTVIAVGAAILLFLIPAGTGEPLMDWPTAEKLPWGVLLLFGGGLALAVGFKQTGLAEWIGSGLAAIEVLPLALIVLGIILMVNFLTEITSNVATASVMLPILAGLAQALGVHPFALMVGAAMAASCAFMLPVATAPNAIVYGSGYLSIRDMARAGLWMNVISSTILFLAVYFLLPLVWGIDLAVFPF